MGCVFHPEMHPMKTSSLRTSLIALALIVCSAAYGQPTAPSPAKTETRDKSEVRQTPSSNRGLRVGESRELAEAKLQLDRLLEDYGEKHPTVVAQRSKIAMLEKLEPTRLDIDFPGGSLEQLMKKIETVEGVSFSIVNGEGIRLSSVNLPPFSVRNVNVGTMLQVMRGLLPKEIALDAAAVEPNSVVCILKRRDAAPNVQAAFGSFQLGPYLAEQSVDNIVAAIRVAWELDPNHEPEAFRIKFHQPTGILLVSGPPQAVNIAQSVVTRLKRNAEETPEPINDETQVAREKGKPEDWNAEIQRRRASRQTLPSPTKADEKK